MTELVSHSATGQLAELASGRASARELLDAHLARHDAVHGELNAVVALDRERARAEAARIDDARARGLVLGPLAGLPMTVKDCFDVAGLPAVCGSPALVGRAPDCADADVVATVRAAGAVVWGKTNVPFMLADHQSYNTVYGTTTNPYDRTRTPGGSSGGAAAALAARVTPLEIGSDIGGSLRHPAGFCGIHALKPTWRALSMRGQVPPDPGTYVESDLAVVGPMARTVPDLRLLWDILRGAEPTLRPPDGPVVARVAVWLDEPEFTLSTAVRDAVGRAAEVLREQGATVDLVAAPVPAAELLETYFALLFPILTSGLPDRVYARMLARRPEAEGAVRAGADRYGPEAAVLYGTAAFRDVERARVRRRQLKDALTGFFTRWDAIVTPVSPVPAFPHTQEGAIATRVLDVDGATVPYQHMLDWAALATATHLPALATPVGATAAGLPIGAQLIGAWGREDRLLDLATVLEQALGGFRPPAALAA